MSLRGRRLQRSVGHQPIWPSASRSLTQYVVMRKRECSGTSTETPQPRTAGAQRAASHLRTVSTRRRPCRPPPSSNPSSRSTSAARCLMPTARPASAALCTRGCMVGYTLMYDGCNPMYQARQRQTCSRSSHWCGCWPTRAGAAGLRAGPRPPQGGPASLWRHRSRPGGARAALSRRSITTRSTTSTHSCTVLASSCPCPSMPHARATCTCHAT